MCSVCTNTLNKVCQCSGHKKAMVLFGTLTFPKQRVDVKWKLVFL